MYRQLGIARAILDERHRAWGDGGTSTCTPLRALLIARGDVFDTRDAPAASLCSSPLPARRAAPPSRGPPRPPAGRRSRRRGRRGDIRAEAIDLVSTDELHVVPEGTIGLCLTERQRVVQLPGGERMLTMRGVYSLSKLRLELVGT